MSEKLRIRAALLVGPGGVPDWMAEAIRMAMAGGVEVPLILRCDNPLFPRQPFKHALYYLLNILVLRRGSEEKSVSAAELGLADATEHRFIAENSGRRGWQRIPESIAEVTKRHGCEVVIKAGMGLLENPEAAGVPLGMLSYHHGDPACYRGRPAGFWEIMEGAETMGFMVQRINDQLDVGAVLAFGRSKVHAHSYRLTLASARRLSSHLLLKAIVAAKLGEELPISKKGRNYRLPSNTQVVLFALKVAGAKIRRLCYGAFVRKSWHVGVVDAPPDLLGEVRLAPPSVIQAPRDYLFLADGFWSSKGSIFAEAMRRGAGLAELVEISDSGMKVISDNPRGHWSYPFSFCHNGENFVLPEVAGWSAPFIWAPQGAAGRVYLRGLENERLVDPTLFHHNERWYLFASSPPYVNESLRLWVSSKGPEGPYTEHPSSPIVLDATSARMAGPLLVHQGAILRLGQDFSRGYGSAISVQRVGELTPERYKESSVAQIRAHEGKGPHSYSVRDGKALCDWYTETFSLGAGFSRIRSRLS